MADENQAQAQSFLEMSDDDLLKMGPPDFSSNEPVIVKEPKEPSENDEGGEADEEQERSNEEGKQPQEGTTENQEEEQQEQVETKPKPVKEKATTKEPETKETTPEPKPAEQDADKAFAAAIRAPFKANGREMQVNTAEEAIQLMQMGANYNKKMAALKPSLGFLKQLEKNDLLSEEKINFLIDLSKKNPEAIGKLLQDSGVDPLEINEEAVKSYKPQNHSVSQEELALDEVLESIRDTDTFGKLMDTVGNQWDEASRGYLAKSPQVLRILNNHVAQGHFDTITNEVERRKALGNFVGVSDLEAYKTVGDELHAKGAFKPKATETPAKKIIDTKPQVSEEDRADKRRAAAPAKTTPTQKNAPSLSPLAMSDEEIAKMGVPKFI